MKFLRNSTRPIFAAAIMGCSAWSSHSQTGSEASILGIYIGMPASKAWEVLSKHQAKYGNLMQLQKATVVSRCKTCPPYVAAYSASYVLGNRHPGPLSKDEVVVLLSPEADGAQVVGVRRRFILKEAVSLNSLTDQLTTKHGNPNQSNGGVLAWFLDEKHQKVREAPTVRYSTSTLGAQQCFSASGDGFRLHTIDIAKSSGTSDQELSSGEFSSIHAKCGTTIHFASDANHQSRVQFVDLAVIDHPGIISAGVKARQLLNTQNAKVQEQESALIRSRTAPKLD